jgi:hypothetical protein
MDATGLAGADSGLAGRGVAAAGGEGVRRGGRELEAMEPGAVGSRTRFGVDRLGTLRGVWAFFSFAEA